MFLSVLSMQRPDNEDCRFSVFIYLFKDNNENTRTYVKPVQR